LWQIENSGHSCAVLEDELRSIQTFAALKPSYKVLIYLAANFSGSNLASLNADIVSHKPVLVQLSKSPIQQRQLIAAVEWLCGVRSPAILKFFPAMLKTFFDEEMVEEDVFLEWYQDTCRNSYSIPVVTDETLDNLKATARPFYDWLQEAEEEGEEDDEDDEDEA
jgi:eIF4-gamma/eIF5/eIF2-epsilon